MVFKNLGIELKEIEDWNCCGATAAAKTNDFLAVALPARNLGLAAATGLSEIVIPARRATAGPGLAEDPGRDPGLRDSINAELSQKITGDIKVSSILEVLVPKVRSGELAAKATKKLEGLKPACYYGCL